MTEDPRLAIGVHTDVDVVATMEHAAEVLLPVEVDLGHSSFEAQLFAIERDGAPRAILHPIAAQALPLRHDALLTLRSASASQAWAMRCTDIAALGPAHAAISLAGMRACAPDTQDGAVRASDLLVLVVPGGMNDGIDYVFPITRVGADTCEVRCSSGFAPGTVLPLIEIIGDRRLLRTASAEVTRATPWYGSDGTRAFVCTLALGALEPAPEPAHAAEDAGHDLVTDGAEVKRLLRIAAMREAEVVIESPGHPLARARFAGLAHDHAVLELDAVAGAALASARRTIRIAFELFAVPHELDARPIDHGGTRLRISLPLILRRRRRHRREARSEVPREYGVALRYRHPVTGCTAEHAVTGLSFYGVSFQLEAHGNVLWPGMPLEQAQLVWGERLVHLGDLVVDETAPAETAPAERGLVCRALTQDSRLVDDYELIELLAAIAHPELVVHDGSEFAALHQTYLRAGLFGPHMDRNLAPIYDETAVTWRKLHAGARDMIRTFVYGPRERPDAAVTVMRAWEAGWVLQHFVDASTERMGATSKLQFAYLDHLMPRPDGRYMIFFVKDDNTIMNAYLRRFFETTGTAEALSCTAVELWIRRDASQPVLELDPALCVEPCTPDDELAVHHAAQRAFGAHAAAATSMVPGQLALPDTRARFERAGLLRERDCALVKRFGRVAYAVLEERSSPGLNLTWMLNAAWIIPVHPELDADGQALARALQLVVHRPAQSATGERFLNLPPDLNEAELTRQGFAREARLRFYVLNRAGLHRLFHYTAVRCGELEAMVMRRDRKKRA